MVTATTAKVVRVFLDSTQEKLAKRMNVSTSLISAIEKGNKRITPDFAKHFKRSVGITNTIRTKIAYLQSKLVE
ncbi:hypothetical protein IAW_05013 [Bacillus cereus str. Schrouff]|uniref:helix-turn-helix domain-containing protein n=1 Tax=Bacillus cereus TaxID=1396 RepID=UPI00032F66B5|nr:helix-turn-helix transcriptional regulator [Bacillus cereus]EOO05704.1 hypothetical protein IAW_05013 [Bacillus cereus str. Schrouff]EOO81846.1 hypothetical protein IGY_05557 [Bacillus cereus K-5975c]MCU4896388.1 helix-turn-helix transcriptional regulator [Bacillus cereus]